MTVAAHDAQGLFFLDPVRTLNLSRGGVAFPLARRVSPGTRVWLQLSDQRLSGPPLEREALVRRVETARAGVGRCVAVEFCEPLPRAVLGGA